MGKSFDPRRVENSKKNDGFTQSKMSKHIADAVAAAAAAAAASTAWLGWLADLGWVAELG